MTFDIRDVVFEAISDEECAALAGRSLGCQHINRSYRGVRASHVPTGIAAVAYLERSQLQNREAALARLRVAVDRLAPVAPDEESPDDR